MSKILEHKIYGDDMQAVEITLNPSEAVRAEVGSMLFMTTGIEMQTKVDGGVWKGLQRLITGESFFLTSYTNTTDKNQQVAFAAPYPGKIIPLELSQTGSYLCQRDSFLCSDTNVNVSIALTKRLGAGFFGGEGFILQELSGEGQAFVHAGGTIIEKNLEKGEVLRIDTGCIVAFEAGVAYDIKFVGGFRNALFGGEGLFLATLTGPGKVYLQSLPFSRIADRIIKAAGISRGHGEVSGVAGIGGDIFKKVISGR